MDKLKESNDYIRLDYAAGSAYPIAIPVLDAIVKGNSYATNINGDTKLASYTIDVINFLKKLLLDLNELDSEEYDIAFFSSASEANAYVISQFRSVLLSTYEHDSVRKAAEKHVNHTYFNPFDEVNKKTKKHDLVCLMHQNNETGFYFNVDHPIRKHGKYFMMDCVQSFLQSYVDIDMSNIDFITFSLHKLYKGVTGIGGLIYRKSAAVDFVSSGTTAINPFRGGTPSITLIWGALATVTMWVEEIMPKIRGYYSAGLYSMDAYFTGLLTHRIPVITYTDYRNNVSPVYLDTTVGFYLVLINTTGSKNPFTRLVSIVSYDKTFKMCNTELRKFLETKGILLTISSACKATGIKSSHIMDTLAADDNIKKGVHRISIFPGDKRVRLGLQDMAKYYIEFANLRREKLKNNLI